MTQAPAASPRGEARRRSVMTSTACEGSWLKRAHALAPPQAGRNHALPSKALVVSLEQAVAAPTCSCRLADAGARVIKIERPEGDFARGYDTLARGESAYFVWLNRGKESVVLDLPRTTTRR